MSSADVTGNSAAHGMKRNLKFSIASLMDEGLVKDKERDENHRGEVLDFSGLGSPTKLPSDSSSLCRSAMTHNFSPLLPSMVPSPNMLPPHHRHPASRFPTSPMLPSNMPPSLMHSMSHQYQQYQQFVNSLLSGVPPSLSPYPRVPLHPKDELRLHNSLLLQQEALSRMQSFPGAFGVRYPSPRSQMSPTGKLPHLQKQRPSTSVAQSARDPPVLTSMKTQLPGRSSSSPAEERTKTVSAETEAKSNAEENNGSIDVEDFEESVDAQENADEDLNCSSGSIKENTSYILEDANSSASESSCQLGVINSSLLSRPVDEVEASPSPTKSANESASDLSTANPKGSPSQAANSKLGKTFTCPECGKVFNAHYNLTRHMPVHTGARPFICKKSREMPELLRRQSSGR